MEVKILPFSKTCLSTISTEIELAAILSPFNLYQSMFVPKAANHKSYIFKQNFDTLPFHFYIAAPTSLPCKILNTN